MKHLTSELAVAQIGNRYDLILVAARRARELRHGWQPQVAPGHNHLTTALHEIEEGYVGVDYLLKPQMINKKDQRK